MKRRYIALVAATLLCGIAAGAQEAANADPQALFDRAIALKAAKNSASAESAQTLFAESARLFEIAAASDWHRWYEAGNAAWWAGQNGRAIRDYRAYLAHDPFASAVWENLAEARRSAGTLDPGHEGVLSWPWCLWLASTAAALVGLAALAFSLWLFFRRRPWRSLAVALLIAGAVVGVGCGVSALARPQVAVFVVETVGRKGDSSAYAASPAAPWLVGQEAVVAERRGAWVRILVGNVVSWVPAANLAGLDDSLSPPSAEIR